MTDKKRKSTSKESERPSKKSQTSSIVRVSHISGPDVTKPVIVSSPGISLPDVRFQSFVKANGSNVNLLLHSSEHSALEYTAFEDDDPINKHLKHYVAVFNPETGRLQVTEARRMTVRRTLRTTDQRQDNDVDGDEEEEEAAIISNKESRAALTNAFGTKKSKRAAQSMEENRLLAQGNGGADNPISAVMLSDLKDEDIGSNLALSAALDNKPLPSANLETNEIDQVYSLDTLVYPNPAETTLDTMQIKPWISRISAGKGVTARSRFVVNRVAYLVNLPPDPASMSSTKALQVLRYIQLLLDLLAYTTRLPRRRPIPPVDKWPDNTMSEETPTSFLRSIMNHFFPDRMPKDHSLTLLRTTILALALHIPLPKPKHPLDANKLITEPTDISLDMALDAKEYKKLYRELGCQLLPASEQELDRWGLLKHAKKKKKDDAGIALPAPVFAKLQFPLKFPKLSQGRSTARR